MEKMFLYGKGMVGHIMDGKVATDAMASQVSGSLGGFPLFLSGVRVLLLPRNRQFRHSESKPPIWRAHLS